MRTGSAEEASRRADGGEWDYPGGELELFRAAGTWKAYLRRELGRFLGSRVLEVGAGIGATTEALWREEVQHWVCLEPDASMARRLEERRAAGALPSRCRVVRGGAAAMAPGAFDTVLYVDVLEHIADDQAELQCAARRLVPGGHLVVLAPAHGFLFTPFDRAVGHYRRYGRDDLLARGPRGLEVVRSRYLDAAGLLASLGNRIVLRTSVPSPRQIRVWDRILVPLSRRLDPLLAHRVGKSVLVAWRAPGGASRPAGLRTGRSGGPAPPPG